MNHPFQNSDAWSGGTFDALMFFGETSLKQTFDIADTIWNYSLLNGPYRDRCLAPSLQKKIIPKFSEDGCEQLVGEYRHRDGEISPFVHTTIICDDGLRVYCGIPMGGFPNKWNVGAYPFDDGKSVDWVADFTNELHDFTEYVRNQQPMLAAAFGWFDVMILDELEDAMSGKIQQNRWHQIEIATQTGWQVYPITKLEPLFKNN